MSSIDEIEGKIVRLSLPPMDESDLRSSLKDFAVNVMTDVGDAFLDIIGEKDEYTSGHSGRVFDYVCILSAKFDWEPDILSALLVATSLHDLGKVGWSDDFLKGDKKYNKEIKEEREELYRINGGHPECGAKIIHKALNSLTGKKSLIPVFMLYHHWDYNSDRTKDGYPHIINDTDLREYIEETKASGEFNNYLEGKDSEGVPDKNQYRLGISILRACDSIDATTIKRPHKEKVMSMDEMLYEITDKPIEKDKYHPDIRKLFKTDKGLRDALDLNLSGYLEEIVAP